jgi:hypothetical protein
VSPTIEGFVVTGGRHPGYGGGIYLDGGGPIIAGNVITDNRAGSGGGVTGWGGSAVITGNTIVSNHAQSGGGGGIDLSAMAATLHGNTIKDNQANYGAGLYLSNGRYTVTNNTIAGNTGSSAINLYGPENRVVMANGLAAGNSGTAFNVRQGELDLIHTTIADNGGYGIWGNATETVRLTNTILAGNGGGIWPDAQSQFYGSHNLFWDNGATLFTGTHPIVGNPLFVAPGSGDYRLQAGSPAVDAGTPGGWPRYDLDGSVRPDCVGWDVGACERQGSPCWRMQMPLGVREE